jgi:hypothetical protein
MLRMSSRKEATTDMEFADCAPLLIICQINYRSSMDSSLAVKGTGRAFAEFHFMRSV